MDALWSGMAVFGGLVARLLFVLGVVFALVGVVTAGYYGFRAFRRMWLGSRHLRDADRVLARDDVHYAPSHIWVRAGDARVRLGMDDLVRRVAPPPETVELAEVGAQLRRGDPIARLRVDSRTLEIPAPMDGKVVAVNKAVTRRPALLRRAYSSGWLVEVRPADQGWTRLPRGSDAVRWLRAEQELLAHRVEHELGIAGADGGELLVPWEAHLAPARRIALARELLTQDG